MATVKDKRFLITLSSQDAVHLARKLALGAAICFVPASALVPGLHGVWSFCYLFVAVCCQSASWNPDPSFAVLVCLCGTDESGSSLWPSWIFLHFLLAYRIYDEILCYIFSSCACNISFSASLLLPELWMWCIQGLVYSYVFILLFFPKPFWTWIFVNMTSFRKYSATICSNILCFICLAF